MGDKVNFVFYDEWLEYFAEMNDKEIAQTMRAIFAHIKGIEVTELKGIAAVTFKVMKNQIDRDIEKYIKKCEKNRENIERRWRNDTNNIPNEYERNTNDIPNDTTVYDRNTNVSNWYGKDKEKDNDNENIKEKINKKEKFGEFENVFLTESELEKLKQKFPYDFEKRIETLSGYIASKGVRYKSHYATILMWARKEKTENNPETKKRDFLQHDYAPGELNALFDNLDELVGEVDDDEM